MVHPTFGNVIAESMIDSHDTHEADDDAGDSPDHSGSTMTHLSNLSTAAANGEMCENF